MLCYRTKQSWPGCSAGNYRRAEFGGAMNMNWSFAKWNLPWMWNLSKNNFNLKILKPWIIKYRCEDKTLSILWFGSSLDVSYCTQSKCQAKSQPKRGYNDIMCKALDCLVCCLQWPILNESRLRYTFSLEFL
mgnify:CR=1 FL=1